MTDPCFAVLLQMLEETDAGFPPPHRFRFRVEQVDGDAHYFLSRERAEKFIDRHGLYMVDDAEMDRVREEMAGS